MRTVSPGRTSLVALSRTQSSRAALMAGIEAAKNGTARCLLTASDASDKTVKEVEFYCGKYGIKHLRTELSKSDIGKLCGKDTAVLAVTDQGFTDGFEKIISE